MRYRPSIAKLKGKKHHAVRGNPTKYVGCDDCTQEERQKLRRSQKFSN